MVPAKEITTLLYLPTYRTVSFFSRFTLFRGRQLARPFFSPGEEVLNLQLPPPSIIHSADRRQNRRRPPFKAPTSEYRHLRPNEPWRLSPATIANFNFPADLQYDAVMPIKIISLILATSLWLPSANGSLSPYRRRGRFHLHGRHLHHRRQQWKVRRGIPPFFRGIIRGGGTVAVAADVDASGGDSSTEASLDMIDDGPYMVNERVSHIPATDKNIHNDTNYNDSDLVRRDEVTASTTATTSAAINTDADATTHTTTLHYVTKKDGTIELFDEDKVSKKA